MISKSDRNNGRVRRKRRIRKKITGTATRPRLTVFRSNRHVYAQIVNDELGQTMVSASSLENELAEAVSGKEKKEGAAEVGKLLASRAKEHGIEQVVFDRNGYIYHGRVAAVANGAREGGLDF